jgi:hypothetical protein
MNFGFMDVILLNGGHRHVSATHVAIFMVARTRTQTHFNNICILGLTALKKATF